SLTGDHLFDNSRAFTGSQQTHPVTYRHRVMRLDLGDLHPLTLGGAGGVLQFFAQAPPYSAGDTAHVGCNEIEATAAVHDEAFESTVRRVSSSVILSIVLAQRVRLLVFLVLTTNIEKTGEQCSPVTHATCGGIALRGRSSSGREVSACDAGDIDRQKR